MTWTTIWLIISIGLFSMLVFADIMARRARNKRLDQIEEAKQESLRAKLRGFQRLEDIYTTIENIR